MVKSKVMKSLIVLLMGLFAFSCEKPLFKSDELSLPKEDFSGNQLKTNGYFYDPYQTSDGSIYHDVYFYYRNGVVLYGGTYEQSNLLTKKEQEYKDGTYYNNIKDSKDNWGIFVVNGTNIKFERWYPSSGGPLRAYIEEGEVLNDTTFHISKSYRIQNGSKKEEKERDRTYHFKPLSPKPDSTNEFTQ